MDWKDIGTIAVILIVGLLVLGLSTKVVSNLADDEAVHTSYTTGKDSWHPASNATYFTLTTPTSTVYSNLIAKNHTGGEILAAGNYTFDSSLGTIILVTGSSYNNTNVNLTYDFTIAEGTSYNIMTNGTKTFDNIGKQTPIIGLLLGAAMIIGSVYFMYQKKFK